MPNINRDYLVVIDVKSGNITAPSMYFYNTDKNTSNIYVQLVKKETTVDATPIENATNYIVEAKIVKPGPVSKELTGVLVNDAEAIYEFDLPNDCTNLSGSYKIEFWVKAKVNDRDEMITSSKAKYTVKPSILTDLDEAIEDSDDYPLFLKLMEEVKVINETAHELDTTIRTLQADMIEANNEMKANEATRQANETTRVANEVDRIAQENARQEYLNTFDGKWQEYKANTDADIADYKAQINAQESVRNTQEQQRQANEQRRIANDEERKIAERQRKANENVRIANEKERKSAEQSRISAENARANVEEIRQTNEANREAAEEIRKTNEQARIAEHETFRTEQQAMKTELDEVKAENAILMENDKKVADRMTQVEISDKRQYVIMEGLMNSAGDGYLKIEDTGNDTTLYNSVEGFVDVKNITGNTMVNSIKNPDDEFTLNADINTSGQSVTLTTAVDNGQVDVLAEGNTMVNVCDQKEAVAITKSYTVENGNHVALQGEYDGKARPVPTGNTLVNIITGFVDNGDFSTGSYSVTADGTSKYLFYNVTAKTNTVYTVIANITKNTINNNFSLVEWNVPVDNERILIPNGFTGIFVQSFTTANDGFDSIWNTYLCEENTTGEIAFDGFMILEGDYTNKPIPDYFIGMQSSFEDKLVPENILGNYTVTIAGQQLTYNINVPIVANNDYTVYLDIEYTGKSAWCGFLDSTGTSWAGKQSDIPQGVNIFKITSLTNNSFGFRVGSQSGLVINKLYVVEGDYPDYDPTKAGKYRVDYKVTGKNKFDMSKVIEGKYQNCDTNNNNYEISFNSNYSISDFISIKGNTNYYITGNGFVNGAYYDIDKNPILGTNISTNKISPNNARYMVLNFTNKSLDLDTIQLEEGNTATAYEPYKEFTKTYYLNSPLLEGDTIEESNGNVYHVHRYKEAVLDGNKDYIIASGIDRANTTAFRYDLSFNHKNESVTNYCDSLPSKDIYGIDEEGIVLSNNNLIRFSINNNKLSTLDIAGVKQYLSNNPIKVVFGLASPTYELISQSDTILTDSYVAGHLDFDTAVPVEKVEFYNWYSYLKYLYPSTNYILQFESDNTGILNWFNIGGSALGTQDVVKGINRFNITSNETLTPLTLSLSGIGFSASNIVVTEATDKDFGYFSGMKSVGELEENTIEIVSANGTDSTAEGYLSNSKQILLNEPLRAVGDTKDRFVQIDGKWYVERNCTERNYETDDETNTSYKTDKIKTVYTLPSPTYEPVEIAPTVNTYTDVTHITNNSTIPMNMPIVNSGYECIINPSTKYTVVGCDSGRIGDSTIVNGTITTPATITDNFLRPYGTGKTSKVMLLEGEPANIPGYFKGIKSVFEDKVTEDGKYACQVRVYNDLGEETVQTLYLDEPLYNTNNITIYNDKLGYWKNWDKVVLDGSEDENYTISGSAFSIKNILNFDNTLTAWQDIVSRLRSNYEVSTEGTLYNGTSFGIGYKTSNQALRIRIHNINTVNDLRQHLSQNPITVAYQLKEPVFVPLIDNCPNWVIGSWDNCSIHFDSIIPLLATRYRYTGNVPSVVAMSDDVDTVSSISDEQDALLIDMATELAVMKLTM